MCSLIYSVFTRSSSKVRMKRQRGASVGTAEAVEQIKQKRTRLSQPEAKCEARQTGSTGQGETHAVHSYSHFFFSLPC